MELFEQKPPWPQRIATAAGLGLSGVITMTAILVAANEWRWPDAAIYLGAAAFGAAFSALAVSRFFGHPHASGWALAVFGSVLATTLGSFLGGLIWAGVLIAVDQAVSASAILQGAAFCVAIVWIMVVEEPLVTGTWFAAMLAVHLGMIAMRRFSSESSGCP